MGALPEGGWELILPSQLLEGRDRSEHDGPLKLLCAVLDNAVSNLKDIRQVWTTRTARLYREDLHWLESDDESYVTSFVSICHALQFDPGAIRAALAPYADQYRAAMARPKPIVVNICACGKKTERKRVLCADCRYARKRAYWVKKRAKEAARRATVTAKRAALDNALNQWEATA